MNHFGNTLRVLRNKQNLTQTQLGQALGLSYSTISMYERGEREPDFETIEMIADYFNVNIASLLDKSSKKTPNIDNEFALESTFLYLSAHEKALIEAYRAKLDMQSAVDTLLGIKCEQIKEQPNRTIKVAAYGGGITQHEFTATDEELQDAIDEGNLDQYPLKR